VTFDATERDLGHVRMLGGDEQVVAALISCRAAGGPAPNAAPPPAPAAPAAAPSETALAPLAAGDTSAAAERQPPGPEGREAAAVPTPVDEPRSGEATDAPVATARITPSTLTLTAGESGSITVDVSLAGQPLAGLDVLLGGLGGPTGEALRGVTDARGRVDFTIVAGTTARLYNLPVRSVDGRLPERSGLLLEVVPGPATRALLSPPRVRIGPLAETTLRIRAAITDDYGNPIVGERIELLHPQGDLVAAAVTDERGSAPLVFDTAAIGEAPLLLLFLADRALAELPVERDPDR
jgi:hypothetical protein